MNTKLTLRLNETLIRNTKVYAKNEGKSLSQIVSEYFKVIGGNTSNIETLKLKPITSKLHGSLKGSVLSKNDYKKHIERKYL